MRTLVALVAGALAGGLLWPALRPTLSEPIFERENYRGHRLPVAAGLVIVLSTLFVAGAWILVLAGWDDERAAVGAILWSTTMVAAGFGLLGLLDDLAGSGASRGFRGHLRVLAAGRLSTGLVKLAGGAVVALVAIASLGGADGVGELIVRGAVVALAANLANLFDRAPGRVVKVALLAFAVVAVVVRLDAAVCGPALVVGAGAAMLVPDLRERCMLGDTGANVLGAAIGLAVAASVATSTAIVVAVGLAALNIASEWVSFSRVIDRVAVLRWADRLGAPHRAV